MEWVNEREERGLPYDICVHGADGGRQFVEVKATVNWAKTYFEISHNE